MWNHCTEGWAHTAEAIDEVGCMLNAYRVLLTDLQNRLTIVNRQKDGRQRFLII